MLNKVFDVFGSYVLPKDIWHLWQVSAGQFCLPPASLVSSAVLQRLPQAAELKDLCHCWLRFSAALARP